MAKQDRKPADSLIAALDEESFEWLMGQNPRLVAAIQREVEHGAKPEDIRYIVLATVGPERAALASRCEQAARHMNTNGNGE